MDRRELIQQLTPPTRAALASSDQILLQVGVVLAALLATIDVADDNPLLVDAAALATLARVAQHLANNRLAQPQPGSTH